MPKLSTALVAAAGALLAVGTVAAPSHAADGGRPFTVTLTGAAEVGGAGDPNASGTAVLRINPGQGTVCYHLADAMGIDAESAAHIHEGAAGTNGGVVVALDNGDCVEADRATILEIFRDPANYYVNVHTAAFPGGAIRGQLS